MLRISLNKGRVGWSAQGQAGVLARAKIQCLEHLTEAPGYGLINGRSSNQQ
jgi:hypothetical protein